MRTSDPSETIEYLSQSEITVLFDAAKGNVRDEAMLRLGYWVGLRASEVGKIRRDDWDADAKRIKVRRVKGSLSGIYPVPPRLARLLNRMLKERDDDCGALFISNRRQPISRRTVDVVMKRHAKAAGIPEPKRHFHVLKHSIAMHLLDEGKDVLELREWLGHKNVQNSLHYLQLRSDYRDEIAGSMMEGTSIVSN